MRQLAIDCATEALSVALFDGGTLLAHDHRIIGRGHAEALVPAIAALPDRGRAERIAVSLGPGSFTGTRIGIAAARALGLAWRAETVGYPTLALVASQARALRGSERVCVVMAGGHGEWFVQPFAADGSPSAEHRSLAPEDAVAWCDAPIVAGTRADAFVEATGQGEALALFPDARAVGGLDPSMFTDRLMPIYGRPPDATPLDADRRR